jgi:hypothetical protein
MLTESFAVMACPEFQLPFSMPATTWQLDLSEQYHHLRE